MTHKLHQLLQPYQAALGRYLKQGPTASRQPARRLGRRALKLGLQTLDLSMVHESALSIQVLPLGSAAARSHAIRRAGTFFAEAILPMETTHRSAIESNLRLVQLNRTLDRRTLDLAQSNRKLKREMAHRGAVERNLRKSESHSRRLLAQSRRLQMELRQLSRRILSAQEDERKRISRELHDVIAQVLTGINVRLAVLTADATVDSKGLAQKIAHTQKMVEESVNIVHRFAYDLRPAVLDHLGLVPALHSLVKSFTKETGIRVKLTAFEEPLELGNAKRTALYRVAQETLANVARHSQARQASLSIQRIPGAVRLKIRDNGKGFDVEQVFHSRKTRRLGLIGMRERVEMVGGRFTVVSMPGKGTTVEVLIPFTTATRERIHP